MLRKFSYLILSGGLLFGAAGAYADTIDPVSFTAGLAVGESTTIRKTVVVEETTSTALLDVHFLIDTSGSMGAEIAQAKAAASAILSGLSSFGNLAVGVGVYSEAAALGGTPPGGVINQDVTTNLTDAQTAINAVTLYVPDGGGDFPERGQDATYLASENVSWRTSSNRVIIALGDASWKNDVISDATALASLTDNNVSLIGIDYGTFSYSDPDSDDTNFAQSVGDLGGSVYAGGTSTDDIVNAIIAGVTATFASYSTVSVDDLGGGLPGVDVSVACVSAAAGGTCSGDSAVGSWTREAARTFEFDVTFTALEEGLHVFDTYALVNGGIVATEADEIAVSASAPGVPVPAPLALIGLGLLGVGVMRRRAA